MIIAIAMLASINHVGASRTVEGFGIKSATDGTRFVTLPPQKDKKNIPAWIRRN